MWAFWANGYGSWYSEPQRVTLGTCDEYWRECGNASVKQAGYYERDGYMTFASESKKEVETFMKGYAACESLIRSFVS